MNNFQNWARQNYSTRQRVVVLAMAGVFFLLILPFLLFVSSNAIDGWLHLPDFSAGTVNLGAGLILILAGGFLALWSILSQITVGTGTPLPMMPTKKLVAKGPFAYCRNPMTLGTIIAYLGIGVWLGSLSALAIVLIFGSFLLLYIKYIEEKELEARFGQAYLKYKRSTPFILPRPRK